ncbi:enediyne biosynthesis protein UnbU [Streptosporangium sp. NPDC050855]|uniref:enediyne biosynthesis protein UnbU n=1 Tax=Streptosporangium sp. NPDC050855 TaxID=3366194 RepID=UPI00378F83F9
MTPTPDTRTTALRRFAMSITAFTVIGHAFLGFEQAYATPLTALVVAYAMELALERIDATANGRPVKYAGGGWVRLVDFLLPAHISALACAMLLYANDRLEPVIFAVIVSIASKYLIRVRLNGSLRHVLNPSNTGIVAVLLLFPWVGIAPPYHFTEWVSGPLDWIIPVAILASGTMLNAMLTKKVPLILGWVGGFAAQAVIRTAIDGTATVTALTVMTGTAFVLFTNYMITDPGTTPVKPGRQVLFGVAAAAVYGLLVHFHIVFGLFFALVITCVIRGAALAALSLHRRADRPQPATVRNGTLELSVSGLTPGHATNRT